ncbi:MAG: hypothetical protein HQL26_11105 [Candidatus Omnitrophica bacterium]|nr:hypothetical protein [Candidatus Omnitrophota bacterium]
MKITQEAPFQRRTFEILDSKIIKVVIERFGNINEFTVDPVILDPNAQRVRHISPVWKLALGFLGGAVFIAVMI